MGKTFREIKSNGKTFRMRDGFKRRPNREAVDRREELRHERRAVKAQLKNGEEVEW